MSLEATTKYLAVQLLSKYAVSYDSETLIAVDGVSHKVANFDKFLTTEVIATLLESKPEYFMEYHKMGQHKTFVVSLARKLVRKLSSDRKASVSDSSLPTFDYQNLCHCSVNQYILQSKHHHQFDNPGNNHYARHPYY